MNTPAVSVIIPVHNAERYLCETLETLLAQTLQDYELICVENGSTDSTSQLLESYAAKDSRVRVLHFGPIGAGAARNEGIDAARGRHLCFCDADDLFAPNMLERLYQAAEQHGAELVLCAAEEFADAPPAERRLHPMAGFPDTQVAALVPNEQPFRPTDTLGDKVLQLTAGAPWGKLLRTDFVRAQQLRFSDHRYSEDIAFTYPAMVTAQTAVFLPQPLVAYRNCDSSRSHSKSDLYAEQLEAFLALTQQMQQRHVPACVMSSLRKRLACDLFWIIGNLSPQGKQGLRLHYLRDYEPVFGLFPQGAETDTQRDPYLSKLRHFFFPKTRFVVPQLPPPHYLHDWLHSLTAQLYPGHEIWCTAPAADAETEDVLRKTAEEHLHFFRILSDDTDFPPPPCITMPKRMMMHPRTAWSAARQERRQNILFRPLLPLGSLATAANEEQQRVTVLGKALYSVRYHEPDSLRHHIFGYRVHTERL